MFSVITYRTLLRLEAQLRPMVAFHDMISLGELQADFSGAPSSFLTAVVKWMSTRDLHLGNHGLVLFVRKQI